MGSINSRPLKAYVRFDGSGRIVAGSLILRKNKPKVGKWKEIQAYECCITTSSSTTLPPTTTTTTTAALATCEALGRAAGFAILGASAVTNTGATEITGDLGLYPGTSVTGFPPGTVSGLSYITDTQAQNAQTDAITAKNCLLALPPDATLSSELNGTTVLPGVYDFASSAEISGTVTLDGAGNSASTFVFQIPSTFIPGTGAIVNLTNGAEPCNIYWIVGSSATLSAGSEIYGNIIAQTSITINTGAQLTGRAFALTGAVTMNSNSIGNCNCTANPCAT